MSGGGFGGGSFRGGGFGGHRMMVHRGGGFGGGAIAARPGGLPGGGAGFSPGTGGFRQAAINNPGGRFDNRFGNAGNYYGNRGDWRYGAGAGGRYPYYGRYPGYGRYYGGRYPYYGGYYGNYYNGWGWGAAGLATGAVIGAAASTYYTDPAAYQTPVSSEIGGYCATPTRTCALTSSAPVGIGCSCRTQGGRARGTVVTGL